MVKAVAQSLGDDAPMQPVGSSKLERVEIGEVVAEASMRGVGACDALEHAQLV